MSLLKGQTNSILRYNQTSKITMSTEIKNKEIKEFYDQHISERYENDYEFNRWFLTPRLRADYFMNYMAIKNHVSDIDFKTCLELGPGPGTWTSVLYKMQPNAEYDLVDISNAMRDQFSLEMRESENVTYNVQDILKFESEKKYDLFFSSRAVEYLEDKKLFLEKVYSLLNDGGQGVIITKNKDFGFRRRKENRFQHQGQMSPEEFKDLLNEVGFRNVRVFPVIIRTPIVDRLYTGLSEKIFKKNINVELKSSTMSSLSESFLIKFKK